MASGQVLRGLSVTTILSYGGGVNSTAIIALAKMGELSMPDYIVFSDTGAEYPHTYKYLDYLESQGVGLIYLAGGTYRVKEDNWETLVEYCQRKKTLPSIFNRWCSMDWKVRPVDLFRDDSKCPEDCPHCPESRDARDCTALDCIYEMDADTLADMAYHKAVDEGKVR